MPNPTSYHRSSCRAFTAEHLGPDLIGCVNIAGLKPVASFGYRAGRSRRAHTHMTLVDGAIQLNVH